MLQGSEHVWQQPLPLIARVGNVNYPPQYGGKRQQVLTTVKKGVGEGNLKALLFGLQWHLCGITGLIISCAELGFRSQEFERSPNCFLRVIHGYWGESILLSVLWFLFRNTGVESHPLVANTTWAEKHLPAAGQILGTWWVSWSENHGINILFWGSLSFEMPSSL